MQKGGLMCSLNTTIYHSAEPHVPSVHASVVSGWLHVTVFTVQLYIIHCKSLLSACQVTIVKLILGIFCSTV